MNTAATALATVFPFLRRAVFPFSFQLIGEATPSTRDNLSHHQIPAVRGGGPCSPLISTQERSVARWHGSCIVIPRSTQTYTTLRPARAGGRNA